MQKLGDLHGAAAAHREAASSDFAPRMHKQFY